MANALYSGQVSHSRFRPRPHRFRYGISMAWLDVLSFAGTRLTLPLPAFLSLLLPIRRRDHLRGIGTGDNLADAVKALVRERIGLILDDQGSVHLLTGFGLLWHRFNPVSFYFCRDRDGRLQCLVAEVTNTPWNEQSLYVLDAANQEDGDWHFQCAKAFHVSPFMPMDTHYRWHIRQRGDELLINIAVARDGKPLFNAALELTEKPLTTANLLAALIRQPLMSLSVAGRIYWQALRLWLKATPFHPHPYPRSHAGDKP